MTRNIFVDEAENSSYSRLFFVDAAEDGPFKLATAVGHAGIAGSTEAAARNTNTDSGALGLASTFLGMYLALRAAPLFILELCLSWQVRNCRPRF